MRRACMAVAMVLMLGSATTAPFAQEDAPGGEQPKIWWLTTELTSVVASGNSQSKTFGLGFTVEGKWPKSLLKFEGGGTRSEATLTSRAAVGSSSDFQIEEEQITEKTAEFYYLRSRYDYNLSSKFFLFGAVGWLRNIFAGIDSRVLTAAGVGNTWSDTDKIRFQTSYSLTYTFQQDVVDNPSIPNNFLGALLGYDLTWQLTQSTQLLSYSSLQWNLDNTDDVWIDFNVALPIAISEVFYFKPAWQVIWRNQPALTSVGLFDTGGNPVTNPDGSQVNVPVPLKKTDSFVTLALVMKL